MPHLTKLCPATSNYTLHKAMSFVLPKRDHRLNAFLILISLLVKLLGTTIKPSPKTRARPYLRPLPCGSVLAGPRIPIGPGPKLLRSLDLNLILIHHHLPLFPLTFPFHLSTFPPPTFLPPSSVFRRSFLIYLISSPPTPRALFVPLDR